MGFEKQDDQSTYTLRARSDVSVREMKNEIVNWSECVESYIDVEDWVDLYYVTVAELDEFNKAPIIDSVTFVYDIEIGGDRRIISNQQTIAKRFINIFDSILILLKNGYKYYYD